VIDEGCCLVDDDVDVVGACVLLRLCGCEMKLGGCWNAVALGMRDGRRCRGSWRRKRGRIKLFHGRWFLGGDISRGL